MILDISCTYTSIAYTNKQSTKIKFLNKIFNSSHTEVHSGCDIDMFRLFTAYAISTTLSSMFINDNIIYPIRDQEMSKPDIILHDI